MSDLLTPAESNVFQSFLSSIDYSESNDSKNAGWSSSYSPGNPALPDVPHAQGREALAKATKDLMSLDSEAWNSSSMMQQYQQTQSYTPMSTHSQYAYDFPNQSQHHRQHALYHQQSQRNDPFPFLSKQSTQPPHLTHSHSSPPHTLHHSLGHSHVPQPISIAPLHTLSSAQQEMRSGSSMRPLSSMSSPPTTSASSATFLSFAGSGTSSVRRSSNASTLPSPPSSAAAGSPGSCQNKRSLESGSFPSNKRLRPSPPAASSSTPPSKATLLSPSQKKANHIQSEQKRRANIRRGYEALCETVPALREAIRLEEEAQMNADNSSGRGSKAKRNKRGKADDGTGEKIDGRAGPRSENIVLGKTIDYINELLNDRQMLLARLERARSSLAPGESAAQPSDPPPLWEREWKGGSGREGDADEDEDEEDEE